MDKSFRTILEERMNPVDAAPAAAFTASTTSLPDADLFASIAWTPRVQIKPKAAYSIEKMKSQESARLARKSVQEPLIPLVKLSNDDLAAVRELVQMGGIELENGLSARRLKAAYRLLARRYHPDTARGTGHETFLKVRAHYGRLLGRLPAYL